jgi:ketosteroid isomerase-like protein
MSENLVLVRSIFAAWERGEFSFDDWAGPEIEYTEVGPLTPEEGLTGRGLAGMAQVVRDFFSAYEDLRIDAEEYRELDSGRVLAVALVSGRGKSSGAPGDMRVGYVFSLQDGRVSRLDAYARVEDALKAVGLEE